MLVDAAHTAFEDREITFDRVRRDLAASVFESGMIDGAMVRELFANGGVPLGLVGHEVALAADIGADDREHDPERGAGDMKATG
jgi:hypothetical protein